MTKHLFAFYVRSRGQAVRGRCDTCNHERMVKRHLLTIHNDRASKKHDITETTGEPGYYCSRRCARARGDAIYAVLRLRNEV